MHVLPMQEYKAHVFVDKSRRSQKKKYSKKVQIPEKST